MTDPIKVTLELRGEKYHGEITDADGLLFMSTIFNQEENALMEMGQIEEAAKMYKRRSDKRLEELRSQGKSDEELLNEWGQHLLNRVERDPDVRSLVASRIRERFPSIPASLIRWSGKHNFAINLHIVELLQLLNGIIVPSMQLLNVTVQPVVEEDSAANEPMSPREEIQAVSAPQAEEVPVEIAPVTPEVVQPDALDEEISHLEAMLEQRKAQKNAASLEAAIVRQRQ